MAPRRVFISHTSEFAGYPERRWFPKRRSFVDAAIAAVKKAGYKPVEMSDFAVESRPSAEVCRKEVEASHVYVALVGFRVSTRKSCGLLV